MKFSALLRMRAMQLRAESSNQWNAPLDSAFKLFMASEFDLLASIAEGSGL